MMNLTVAILCVNAGIHLSHEAAAFLLWTLAGCVVLSAVVQVYLMTREKK